MSDSAGTASRGGLLTLASAGTTLAVQLVTLAILGRILTAADFGLVAIGSSLLAFAQSLLFMGLARAEARVPLLSRGAQSSLFWVNVAVGVVLAAVLAVLATVLPAAYDQPELLGILLVVSATPLILSLHVQSRITLIRGSRFGLLARCEVAASTAAAVAAIALAVAGAGYWSLVAIPVANAVVLSSLIIWGARWRPTRVGARREVAALVREGAQIFGSEGLQNLSRFLLIPAISMAVPAYRVGQFDRAQQMATLPVNAMLASLQRVAIPVLARASHDVPRLLRGWQALELLMVVAPFTGLLVLAALSKPVTAVVLGPGWDLAAELVVPLSIVGAFRAVALSTNWVLVATGSAWPLLRLNLWAQPLMVAAAIGGVRWGIAGVAWVMALAAMAYWPVQLAVAAKIVDVKWREVLAEAAGAMVLVSLPVASAAWVGSSLFSNSLASLATGLVAAALIAGALWLASSWHRRRFARVWGLVRASRSGA